MISIPEELKKKLTSCRRTVSRLTEREWDIDRVEALRSELKSLNGELFDLFPEDDEFPSEITDKVVYYDTLMTRYINNLKSTISDSLIMVLINLFWIFSFVLVDSITKT